MTKLFPGAFVKRVCNFFYLSGWIEKTGKIEYDKGTSKKRISISEEDATMRLRFTAEMIGEACSQSSEFFKSKNSEIFDLCGENKGVFNKLRSPTLRDAPPSRPRGGLRGTADEKM